MSVEPAPAVAGDREPPRRVADVPARPRLRRPGQRDRRPVRRGRAPTTWRSGRSARASGIDWSTPFETTLEWDLPFAKWFTGGELNVAYNCVDRHVERGLGDKVAYHWIGEPGDTRTLTYARPAARGQPRRPTRSWSSASRTGDRVAIYMPMIPELPIAMLACARIGAPHTVVFGGFSAEALSRPHQRLRRQGADHRRRRLAARQGGRRSSTHADEALADTPTIEARHRRRPPRRRASTMVPGRDHWWHDIVDRQSDGLPAGRRSTREHMLYLLYTSGTTAKPKGILHTTGGLPARRGVHATGPSSTSSPTTSTGAPPTSAG